MKISLKDVLPIFVIFFLVVIFFYKFFLFNLIPAPLDIITGVYYPWLDYKWGNVVGVSVKNPLISDVVSIIIQWKYVAINSIKNGIFPLWNPHNLLGMPLFANFQSSVINLTNIVFVLPLSFVSQWGLMIVLSSLFSMFSCFLFIRSLGLKTISSLIGAVIFTFSMFSIVWMEYGIHPYVASFLPLQLYALNKYHKSSNYRYLLLFSVFIALQIYGGYPPFVIYSLLFSFIYFVLNSSKKYIATTLKFIIFSILALGLSAPILLPGYELLKNSIHDTDITSSMSNNGYLPLANIVTSIVPNFWGNPATYDYQGQGEFDNNAFYPGLLSLAALTYFLVHIKPNRELLLYLIAILAVFILATENPISLFARSNFGLIFGANGISTRLFLVSNLCFSVLSAYYLDHMLKKKYFNSLLGPLFLFLWLILILVLSRLLPEFLSTTVSNKNTIYSFLFLSVFLIISLFYLIKSNYYKILSPILIFLFTISELFYFGWKYLPFSPKSYFFPNTPITKFLESNSNLSRVSFDNAFSQNMWVNYGLMSPDGYDTLMPLNYYQFASLINSETIPNTSRRSIKVNNYNSNLFSSLSSKYVVSQGYNSELLSKNKDFQLAFKDKSVSIFEYLKFQPFFRFSKIVKINNNQLPIADLVNSDQSTALIFDTEHVPDLQLINSCQSSFQNIDIVNQTNNSYKLITQNNCPANLVISQNYFPGWKASIDSTPTTIYRTNYSLQSIFIQKGRHEIILYYQPQSFILGLIISILTIVIVIFAYFFKRPLSYDRHKI